MVEFNYLRLFISIETVSGCLLQRMAMMDMDCNLQKVGSTFLSLNAMPAKITKESYCPY